MPSDNPGFFHKKTTKVKTALTFVAYCIPWYLEINVINCTLQNTHTLPIPFHTFQI